jgi:Tol biopolymer transport system component
MAGKEWNGLLRSVIGIVFLRRRGVAMKKNIHEKSFSLSSVFHCCFQHFTLAILTTIALSGCNSGGGGEGGGSSAGTNPPASSTTAVVGSGGGTVSLASGASVTIDAGIVKDGTTVTITSEPAPASSSAEITPISPVVRVTIPAGSFAQSPTSGADGISLKIPTNAPANGGQQAVAAALSVPTGLSSGYKYVKVKVKAAGNAAAAGWTAYAKFTRDTADILAGGEVATVKITSDYLQKTGNLINDSFWTGFDLWVESIAEELQQANVPTTGQLFWVKDNSLADDSFVESLSRDPQLPDYSTSNKFPLVLVHGIQAGCEGNAVAYKAEDTWGAFISSFFKNQELQDKYQLYTFSYQTYDSIEENGRRFATVVKATFGGRPVMVVGHSMGGLVARSAMLQWKEQIGANIGGLITLGTPHHGTRKPIITAADRLDTFCIMATDSQGAKDLAWDNFDDPNPNPTCSNPFLCGANGLNTIEKNNNNNYQKYIPYAGVIDPKSPLCILLTTPVTNAFFDTTTYGMCQGAGILGKEGYSSDGLVPEVSARFTDFDGQYHDKQPWKEKLRTYDGIHHVSIHDDERVFTQYPDGSFVGADTEVFLHLQSPDLLLFDSGVVPNIVANDLNQLRIYKGIYPGNNSHDENVFCVNPGGIVSAYPNGGFTIGGANFNSVCRPNVVGPYWGIWYDSSNVATGFYSLLEYLGGEQWSVNSAPQNSIGGLAKDLLDFYGSLTPPVVNATGITNGATGVAVNSAISATFSEALDASTINTSTFTLNGPSGLVAGTVTYNTTTNTATFTPSVALAYNMTYTATITTGVKDLDGNPFASNYSWSFTTIISSAVAVPIKTSIAGGGGHTAAIKNDGTAWTWGSNISGQLGDGTSIGRLTPVQVSGLTGVIAVAGGWQHTVAVKNDGTVATWGWNWRGQLGNGTTTDSAIPVVVSALTDVVAIDAGLFHSIALKSDGTVWGWGNNQYGQLGDGHYGVFFGVQATPVQASGLTGVTTIAAGGTHSVALKSDGTVWAWGNNEHGQIGNSTTTPAGCSECGVVLPFQVSGLTSVITIAAGHSHSIALKNDGTVWTWGSNSYGQLGDGSTTDRYTPIQVTGLTGIIAVASDRSHSIALKNDGTVWTWGLNSSGQLGDETTINRFTPVQVSGIAGVIAIAGGGDHTIALQNDGTVWAWGNNGGQLGDGTTTDRYTPVQVVGFTGVTAPSGGRIAFVNEVLDNTEVYVMNADGSGLMQVTNLVSIFAYPEDRPAWSPDGSRIVIGCHRVGYSEIYLVNADGSGQTRLASSPWSFMSARPSWSPDGSRIVFQAYYDHEIYVMNADGSNIDQISDVPAANSYFPIWSPDGSRILFVITLDSSIGFSEPEVLEIYVVNADGSGQTRLTNNLAYDFPSSWSPDSSRIVFVSNRDGNNEFYVMNADGSGQTRLTSYTSSDTSHIWSPDSSRIVFVSNRDSNSEIYIMNADGSGQTRLTNNASVDSEPVWSPDGSRIAFISNRDGDYEIYTMNADGSSQTRLTYSAARERGLAWSP